MVKGSKIFWILKHKCVGSCCWFRRHLWMVYVAQRDRVGGRSEKPKKERTLSQEIRNKECKNLFTTGQWWQAKWYVVLYVISASFHHKTVEKWHIGYG